MARGHTKLQPLERTRVSKVYQDRLATGLSLFLQWVGVVYFGIDWSTDLVFANQVISEYVQYCYDQRQRLYIVRHSLVAIQNRWPHLKGNIHRSWNTLKSWRLEQRVTSRTPIPLLLLQGICLKCLDIGAAGNRWAGHYFIMSVLLRIGFFGLLRAGELFALRRRHLMFSRTSSNAWVLVVSVVDPKTRAVFGRSQYVLIRDAPTVAWAFWLTRGLGENVKLWQGSGANFRKLLRALLIGWNLASDLIGPGGLRPGGASHMLLEGADVGSIQHQGRWSNSRSLSIYLQESMSCLVLTQLGDHMQNMLHSLVKQHLDLWSHPLPLPWGSYFARRKPCLSVGFTTSG